MKIYASPGSTLSGNQQLARMLQARDQSYCLRIATRPAHERGDRDDLHAWVEIGGAKVIGDLPGTWVVLLNLLD